MECFRTEIAGFPIILEQSERNKLFTVTYGQQVRRELNHSQAAQELGRCILHALACENKVDDTGL